MFRVTSTLLTGKMTPRLGSFALQTHRGGPGGMWSKVFLGNVFSNMPYNWNHNFMNFRQRRFRMKKHRYQKRWQFRRFKIAALANVPFQRKLRLGMLPKLSAISENTVTDGDLDAYSEMLRARVLAKSETQSDANVDGDAASREKGKNVGLPNTKTATPHTRSRKATVTPGPVRIRTKYTV